MEEINRTRNGKSVKINIKFHLKLSVLYINVFFRFMWVYVLL